MALEKRERFNSFVVLANYNEDGTRTLELKMTKLIEVIDTENGNEVIAKQVTIPQIIADFEPVIELMDTQEKQLLQLNLNSVG